MKDLMFKADTKAAWDAYVAAMPETETPVLMIDEIGPVMLAPSVMGAGGEIETPAVMDDAHHVNVRVLSDDEGLLMSLAAGNADVHWIDPSTVSTPARIWSGGMNYWLPAS